MLRFEKCLFAKKRAFLRANFGLWVCNEIMKSPKEKKNTIKINEVEGIYGAYMNGLYINPITLWVNRIKLLKCHHPFINIVWLLLLFVMVMHFIERRENKQTKPQKKTFQSCDRSTSRESFFSSEFRGSDELKLFLTHRWCFFFISHHNIQSWKSTSTHQNKKRYLAHSLLSQA